jgi:ketosteroid isomerase-like protein
MSGANIDLVRRIYAAWEGRELGRDFLAEDVEWVNPPDALEPGLRQGIESFAEAMGSIFDTWEEMRVEPDRLLDVEGEIVMVGHIHGRARGIEVSQSHGHVWTVRDGKVLRFRWFSTGEQALRAVGLQE